MNDYQYATVNRPAMYGTVPEGFTVLSSPRNDECVDLISYINKLDNETLRRFQLIPVSELAYEFSIGETVLVNDCDDAIVTGYASRGRYNIVYCFDMKTTACVKHTEVTK